MRLPTILLTAVALGSVVASASPPTVLRSTALVEPVERYFRGEKVQGGLFLGVGLAALATGAGLATSDNRTAFHSAWPVLGVGLGEVIAGIGLLAIAEPRIAERLERIDRDPEEFRVAESERLLGVHSDLRWLTWIEIVLGAAGAGMAAAGEAERIEPLAGVGYGLAAQAFTMLVLDLFELDRALRYANEIAAPASGSVE